MVDAADLPVAEAHAKVQRVVVNHGAQRSGTGASAPELPGVCRTTTLGLVCMLLCLTACEDPPKTASPPPTVGPLSPSGCALLVPQRGGHVSVADTTDLFPESFTLELWVSFDDIPPFGGEDAAAPDPQRIIAAENLAEDTGFYVEVDFANSRELICAVRRGDVWWTVGYPASELEQPAWRHLACVLDEVGLSMWSSGIWAGTSLRPESFPRPAYVHDGSPLLLGGADARSPSVTRPVSAFLGSIDEVRFSKGSLYSVSLSDAGAILDVDAFAPETSPKVSSSTLALWHFDECAGDVARDSTERARNGNLQGGASWRSPETPDAQTATP